MTQQVLENTSSHELVAASDSNFIAFWSAYGKVEGSTLQVTPKVVWFYTGIEDPLFNGVLYIESDPISVKTTFDDLQTRIEEQGSPAFWWAGPQSNQEELGKLLERQGLQSLGDGPGMAMDLELIDDKLETIANFSIQKVHSKEMQALWAQTAGVGTGGFSDIAIESFIKAEVSMNKQLYNTQPRYIGFLDGTPVATSAMVLDSGVAGIYAVATIPEARRRGIGTIMTVIPLLEAKKLGYRVGILQSSAMGYSVYQKIGFRDVCKYGLFLQSE